MASTNQDVLALRGQELRSSDGEKLGTIEEIYLDTGTEQPEWALVTTGMFGTKQSFVPLAEMRQEGDTVTVPYDKATVKDSPNIDPDGQLSEREEADLYRHYGRDFGSGETSGTTTDRGDQDSETVGRDVSGPSASLRSSPASPSDDAMTRSEEELHVGTTKRESGRVRLRKVVVEDEVTQTVPVRREEVRVEREPITDANVGDAKDGPAISEVEHEVVLHEEEPVAEKRAVPKERVRLDKETQTDERQVSDTVRKEEIEVDDSGRGA